MRPSWCQFVKIRERIYSSVLYGITVHAKDSPKIRIPKTTAVNIPAIPQEDKIIFFCGSFYKLNAGCLLPFFHRILYCSQRPWNISCKRSEHDFRCALNSTTGYCWALFIGEIHFILQMTVVKLFMRAFLSALHICTATCKEDIKKKEDYLA